MNTRRIYQLLLLYGIVLTPAFILAQDAADADYSQELQRIAPTKPAEALKTFDVVPGYKLELVAAEPLVTSPVAASFDEDGRLYVVEMRDYSEQDKEKLGRVRLLTDTDGNGTFDKSTIFAEGLSWPTAIITYDGGVFIGAAPDIWYLKDTNKDGVADERRVVFTGFGRGNVQGLLNSFTWGIDNRIHVAVSSAGAELQRADDKGKATGKPLTLRGRDFSFDPRNLDDFIATSGGGQHGMSFDDWGRKFVCSNSDHIQLIMLEDANIARNPYFAAPNPRISIAVDGPQADVFRISPVEPWREVRTRLRVKGLVPGPIEGGGRAAGYFTSATGITIYRGNAWPKEDRGLAMVGDVGGNLIHRKRLEPHGLELRAKRIDEKREFVASRDNWFRPVQFLNAPDGGLYVLDMYREVIEHPASLPPAIKKHLDLTSGRDRGRIYRVVPEGFKQPPLPKLSTATTAELVALLEHDNGWHRDTAARLLYEANDRAAIPHLHQLTEKSMSAVGQLHAIHALLGVEGSVDTELESCLASQQPELRRFAVRLVARSAPSLLARMEQDEDPGVQLALVLAQGDMEPSRERFASEPVLSKVLERDTNDRWMRAALMSSIADRSGRLLASMLRRTSLRKDPNNEELITALTDQMIRRDEPKDFEPVIDLLPKLAQLDPHSFELIAARLTPSADSSLAHALRNSRQGKEVRAALQPLLADAWRNLESDSAKVGVRIQALRVVQLDEPDASVLRLLTLLTPAQPAELQIAVLDALLAFDSTTTSRAVFSQWETLSPAVRAAAADRFLSKLKLTDILLEAFRTKAFSPSQLTVAEQDRLRNHPEAFVRNQAAKLLPMVAESPRSEIVATYHASLELAADKTRGAELFKKQCSTCHKLGEVGHEIGPNLAAMKARGREAILVNVLDPNREVNPQFVTYSVTTKDGRVLSGMIAAETATSLTLKRAENQQDVVLRIDIEELKSTGQSLMPEGMEKQLDKQHLADVIEFIMSQE